MEESEKTNGWKLLGRVAMFSLALVGVAVIAVTPGPSVPFLLIASGSFLLDSTIELFSAVKSYRKDHSINDKKETSVSPDNSQKSLQTGLSVTAFDLKPSLTPSFSNKSYRKR